MELNDKKEPNENVPDQKVNFNNIGGVAEIKIEETKICIDDEEDDVDIDEKNQIMPENMCLLAERTLCDLKEDGWLIDEDSDHSIESDFDFSSCKGFKEDVNTNSKSPELVTHKIKNSTFGSKINEPISYVKETKKDSDLSSAQMIKQVQHLTNSTLNELYRPPRSNIIRGPSCSTSIPSSSGSTNIPGPLHSTSLPSSSYTSSIPSSICSTNLAGPSSSIKLPGPSSTINLPGLSSSTNIPGPSFSINLHGPLSSTSIPSSSGSTNIPGLPSSTSLPGSSYSSSIPSSICSINLPGPSSSTNIPGPSSSINLHGPSSSTSIPSSSGSTNIPGLPSSTSLPGSSYSSSIPSSICSINLPGPSSSTNIPDLPSSTSLPGSSYSSSIPSSICSTNITAPSSSINLPGPSSSINLADPSSSINLAGPSSSTSIPSSSGSTNIPGLPSSTILPGASYSSSIPSSSDSTNIPDLPSSTSLPGSSYSSSIPSSICSTNITAPSSSINLPGPSSSTSIPSSSGSTNIPGLPSSTILPGASYSSSIPSSICSTNLAGPSSSINLPGPSSSMSISSSSGSTNIPDLPSSTSLPGSSYSSSIPSSICSTNITAPSSSINLPGPSSSIKLPGPSSSINLPGPSYSSSIPSSICSTSITAPSSSINLAGPTSSIKLPGPSSSINLPGPSSSTSVPSSSGSTNLAVPSSSINLAGPSSSTNLAGPSSSIKLPGPSSTINLPVSSSSINSPGSLYFSSIPSSICSTRLAGPSSSIKLHGPSSSINLLGPSSSTNITAPSCSTSLPGPSCIASSHQFPSLLDSDDINLSREQQVRLLSSLYNKLFLNNCDEPKSSELSQRIRISKLEDCDYVNQYLLRNTDLLNTDEEPETENTECFVEDPDIVNPDIMYNIDLNEYYNELDLLALKILKTPDDPTGLVEYKLLPSIPQIEQTRREFTAAERFRFANGISEWEYQIDRDDWNKIMVKRSVVFTAHAGFSIANEESLYVLADVAIDYVKKLAVIMKKHFDIQANSPYPDSIDPIDNSLQEIGVKGGLKELIQHYENDVFGRRNKLLKKCQHLKKIIDRQIINIIKTQTFTPEELEEEYSTIEVEENVLSKETDTTTEEEITEIEPGIEEVIIETQYPTDENIFEDTEIEQIDPLYVDSTDIEVKMNTVPKNIEHIKINAMNIKDKSISNSRIPVSDKLMELDLLKPLVDPPEYFQFGHSGGREKLTEWKNSCALENDPDPPKSEKSLDLDTPKKVMKNLNSPLRVSPQVQLDVPVEDENDLELSRMADQLDEDFKDYQTSLIDDNVQTIYVHTLSDTDEAMSLNDDNADNTVQIIPVVNENDDTDSNIDYDIVSVHSFI